MTLPSALRIREMKDGAHFFTMFPEDKTYGVNLEVFIYIISRVISNKIVFLTAFFTDDLRSD